MKAKQSKTGVAVQKAIRALNFYDMGEALGFESMVSETQWRDVLRSCKTTTDRNSVRDGFIAARIAGGASYDAARRKFYRECALYTPQSSRHRKATHHAAAASRS